ncbi:hypothetical protein LTR08_003285 [Meristemomyces frigidus]|nr:hypothetical protein LTR08_003285 [Meristemomyces frigidus]
MLKSDIKIGHHSVATNILQSSSIATARMAFSRDTLKRKAAGIDGAGADIDDEIQYEAETISESESDCITVAAPPRKRSRVARWPASSNPPRPPLAQTDAAQTNNRRRRELVCVLIPVRSNHTAIQPKLRSTDNAVQTLFGISREGGADDHMTCDTGGQAFKGLRADRSTVKLQALKQSSLLSFVARPRSDATGRVAPSTDAANGTGESSATKRSMRSAPRRSYRIELPEDSDDEPRRSKHKRVVEDGDFEDGEAGSASASPADDEDVTSGNSSPIASEVTDEEATRAKPATSSTRAKAGVAKGGTAAVKATKASGKDMSNLLNRPDKTKGLALNLPPISDINDIFRDMTENAVRLGLGKALEHLSSRPLRIATMCSGTESPLLALQIVDDVLIGFGLGTLNVKHVFSAEIVPYKQAYIERNFAPPMTFRDITEFIEAFKSDKPTTSDKPTATTAYGSRVAIPMDVDIVIAGTSCVDYSALNNKKKGLSADGESGMTWKGALAYCRAARPAIIIFENVRSAEWGTMLEHYRAIDYDCKGAFVNTKDYYIPHTRQRGYMVCFDQQRTSAAGMAMATDWQTLMRKFQRYASSPASSFLLPNDQIRVRQSARDDEPTREVDWSRCEITQMEYRQDVMLGNARPITGWQESGAVAPPDNGSATWYRRQVERVLDTIDCNVLRKALLMYDARFKTRIWDLSQNIYRFTDHSAFGITGCITPDGVFFVSDAGRVLVPEETLKLQGIPLSKISLTTETANEIQDLAGNAMSSTVVGAALLAALISGHKLIHTSDAKEAENTVAPRIRVPLLLEDMEEMPANQAAAAELELDPSDMLRNAERSTRRCYCEGSYGLCKKDIQQCEDCGHTTCTSCGGNPVHNYYQTLEVGRLAPATFEQSLRAQLPLQLLFSSEGHDSRHSTVAGYVEALQAAAAGVFSFASVRRTHCWTVSYAAARARLDMVIEDAHAEWRLFALPEKALGCEDELRLSLEQPIAKAAITAGDELFDLDVAWYWRFPCKRADVGKVTAQGSLASSWWCRIGLPEFKSHTQPDKLLVEAKDGTDHLECSISGTYEYLPKCGKACDSLYRKNGKDERPVYLFLDPTRTGEPEYDEFVFSHSIARLEYDEVRPVIARVKAPWRPWKATATTKPTEANIVADSLWLPALARLRPLASELQMRRSTSTQNPEQSASCYAAQVLVSCTFPSSGDVKLGHQMASENLAYDSRFLSDQAWVFEALRRQLPSEWQTVTAMEILCQQCAPVKPLTRWRLGDQRTIAPYEDPAGAATYERAIKARPAPLVVRLTSGDREGQVTCHFGISLASLVHRAIARLEHLSKSSLPAVQSKIQWKLSTSGTKISSAFPIFQLQATKNLKPYNADLKMSVSLFPKQRLSLAWMKFQEEGKMSEVEEAVEATLPVHGWRVEVRASRPVHVRGGICADHPGFGKTITSLALIKAQLLESTPSQIKAELTARPSRPAKLLVSTATVIVCPYSLTTQWYNEIREKLCNSKGVLTIKTTADLSNCTVAAFEHACIILVNRSVLSSDLYTERLAAFAAMPGPGSSSRRAFAHWRKFASQAVPDHLDILQNDGVTALRKHVKTKYAEVTSSDDFRAAVPSKRLRGKDYVAAKGKASGGKASVQASVASATVDVSNVHMPLFEMFFFNRVIVDEFHQQTANESAAISAIQADKRWGLSATPAMSDFYDIAKMAGLLGVPLRIGGDARGTMKAKNIAELRKDMTAFELFDAMREVPSAAMHARIHEIDQVFLDTFVRRNIMDFAELKYVDHLVPITLDLNHQALYMELSQHLNSSAMRIKKGKKGSASDRQDRLHAAFENSSTAEEALSKTAAFFSRDMDAYAESGAGLDAAILIRKQEVQDLLREIGPAMTIARAKERDQFVSWRITRIDDRTLGDGDAISEIKGLMGPALGGDKADKKKLKARRTASDDDEAGTSAKAGKNVHVSAVNELCKRLVTSKRSLRYLEAVQEIQQDAGSSLTGKCHHPRCDGTSHYGHDVAVSAFCGHVICSDCHKHLQDHGLLCPAPGCSTAMEKHHLLWTSRMGDLQNPQRSAYGAKLDAALNLLEEIQGKGDQAVLFVQFPHQLLQVEAALKHRRIPAIIVKALHLAAAQLEDFRTNPEQTVIVLDSSDETAAGSNLQNANHVLFLSPLLKIDQYEYDSTMAQAVGRVRRHGQKKDIHVYRIVALDTIDVDILEHRERRVDALTQVGARAIEPPLLAAARMRDGHAEPRAERTQLVKEGVRYSLQPQSWLVRCGGDEDGEAGARVKGKKRVLGWEDFSSLVKFSKGFSENDD